MMVDSDSLGHSEFVFEQDDMPLQKKRGKAIMSRFNWMNESKKLLNLYGEIK